MLPNGRTVNEGHLPPKHRGGKKKGIKREISHSDPERRRQKQKMQQGQQPASASNVPHEIRKYVNLSSNAEPVKFKGANSMYNKKPPLAVPGQIPQNMQNALKYAHGGSIGAQT